MEEPTLKKLEETSELVKNVTTETKLICSEYFSAWTGSKISFEPESTQCMGAYRMRGACYKMYALTEEGKLKGLIIALTDSRAQGVAYAAKLAGVKTTVIVPTTTPLMKADRTKSYGADVVLGGGVFDEICGHAYELADEFGYTPIHLFDGLDVATGQDTIAMEIIKELLTAGYILVPIGEGGLCIGVSTLAKFLNPKIKVIGVEPVSVNCMQVSLKEGKVVGLSQVSTTADDTAVKRPDEKLFPYIQGNMDGIITIEDSELIVAFLDMVENHKMIVENPGLLTVTALKRLNVQKKKIISILSGGNVNVITMSLVVQYGLIEKDRVFTVPVPLPDKPGELTRVSVLLAKEQGDIIKLEHNQFISINCNAAVGLHIITEASRTGHKNQIISALISTGYRPKLVKFKGTYSEV